MVFFKIVRLKHNIVIPECMYRESILLKYWILAKSMPEWQTLALMRNNVASRQCALGACPAGQTGVDRRTYSPVWRRTTGRRLLLTSPLISLLGKKGETGGSCTSALKKNCYKFRCILCLYFKIIKIKNVFVIPECICRESKVLKYWIPAKIIPEWQTLSFI